MTNWSTVLLSLCGMLIGAGLAVAGAVWREPVLTNLGATVVGAALGMFVPTPIRPAPPSLPRL